ncbi:MAG: GNAT family N-acetyltransferase [Sphingomonas sp.]|uniref:GNAT family N-acetyltransferase n=1 Tax=Sphingomonas sp. TaxID=28214 RepID=UPI0017A69812|nr:GNAT family N-acetyltransferase [Sphingomonas sp.]MBA3667651.1 GNAT family N-acetyltransferase [Sphingomonas sp.]
MTWTMLEGELDRDDVRVLLSRHFAAMQDSSPPEACHVLPLDSLPDPGIRFFTLREGDVLLGCGALKRIGERHGEIKSMRTAEGALGRGVGGAMLDHLAATAREMGMTRLSLETGSASDFAAAIRLYEREGFEGCKPFGDYLDTNWTLFFTKEI